MTDQKNTPAETARPLSHSTERALRQYLETPRVLMEKLEPLIDEYGATKVALAVDAIQGHRDAQAGVVSVVKRVLDGAQLTDETEDQLSDLVHTLVVATP
jgi:hypothetical protein